ncbi:MAG: diguanylate cyclase [Oscillospiraceae bacterium]|nr:diguanylate cyclase [Oscillospiraceae bacterium]
MYECKCGIMILSGNNLITKVAESAESPKDCTFDISFPESIEAVYDGIDTAIIIDAFDAVNAKLSRFHEAYKVVVLPEDNLQACEAVIAEADAVWTDTSCEALVKANFLRLQKDLKLRFDMRRTENCLTTAIDSIPDLVWFKDDKGRHLIVNNGFCAAVDKTKDMIYKRGHYYIWDMPEEEYEKGDYVCLESEEIVMRARQTVRFDEKVKTKMGMRMFSTYKSPLIDQDGTIFGTCGVAHDVTDLKNINIEIDSVLKSVPFSVIIEGKDHKTVSVNPKFAEYFPECGNAVGKTRDYWQNCAESMTKLENGMSKVVVRTEEGKKILLMDENSIIDTFGEPIGEVFVLRDITAEQTIKEQAAKQENTDLLTGLFNRRGFASQLEKLKNEHQLILTVIDIDDFGKYNGSHDNDIGDIVLRLTAQKLSEIYPTDIIARMGSDEFAIVSTEELSDEEVKQTAERAINTLASAYSSKDYTKGLTVSLGIAVQRIGENEKQDTELLMQKSGKALYSAKCSGKAKYCIF